MQHFAETTLAPIMSLSPGTQRPSEIRDEYWSEPDVGTDIRLKEGGGV